jgi:hypothetical protein
VHDGDHPSQVDSRCRDWSCPGTGRIRLVLGRFGTVLDSGYGNRGLEKFFVVNFFLIWWLSAYMLKICSMWERKFGDGWLSG